MSANTKGIESSTTNVLEAVQKQLSGGDNKGAMESLHTALDQRIPIWVKNHEKIAIQFFDLAVAAGKDKVIRSALQNYQRLCVGGQELGSFEEVVNYLMKITGEKVAKVFAEVESKADEDDADYAIWGMYSDEPVLQLGQRARDNVMQFYTTVFKHCASRTSHDGKYTQLYNSIVQAGFTVCRKHSRSNELFNFSEQSRRQLEDALDREEHKSSIMNKADSIDAIINTRLMQIGVATDLKHWRVAANGIEETKKFFDNVQSQGKRIRNEHWIPFYLQVGKLFQMVDQPVLHSYAMVKGARLVWVRDRQEKDKQESIAILASCAVLSVLCLPHVDTTALSFTSDDAARDQRKQSILERFIGVNVTPNRNSLAGDLEASRAGMPSLLELALPEVQKIYAEMKEVSTFDVCQKVKPLLDAVAPKAKLLEVYIPKLQSMAVQSMLSVMARCYSKVTIPHLQMLVPFYSKEQYVTHLEPLLLKTSSPNLSFSIDMASNSVIMGGSSDVVGALGKFAANLAAAVPVCYKETGKVSKATDKGVVPADNKSLFAQMEAEKQRLAAKFTIAKKRLDCEEERAKDLKKKEAERKQAEIDKIRAIENARFEKLRRDAEAKLQMQHDELRMYGEHEWVANVLKQRHAGLKYDEKIIKTSNDRFKEDMTMALTKHIKSKMNKKNDGLRDREHLERAIREEEVPMIKAMAEEKRESPEEREARLAKRTEQLKKDHEAALAIKNRLAMFAADRKSYEEKFLGAIQRTTAAKESKMNAQEDLLRQEKERRERAAAEEEEIAARKREEDGGSITANAKPAATLGGGKGAWKPKAR